MKKILVLAAATLFLFSGTAFAFHGGGVAHCDGCHSMHNSADNPRSGSALAPSLMKGSDPSSTCLNCHGPSRTGSYHILSNNGANTNQGGDFFWVTDAADYFVFDRSGNAVSAGPVENRGHNVIAADFSMAADGTNTVAPGGSFPSNIFGCNSCHDPHGQVGTGTRGGEAAISVSGSYGAADPVDGSIHGNYRLLEDSFATAPVATADNSAGSNVDYGTGMSGWCLGCHTQYSASNMHPIADSVPVAYNAYVASGDFTGVVATANNGMVPFQRQIADGSLLDPASTAGVSTGLETVMCLSCHRAHASAFDNALRWDPNHEFLADSGILNESTTTLMTDGAIPYYARGAAVDIVATYGEWQRSLCNKCHVQD